MSGNDDEMNDQSISEPISSFHKKRILAHLSLHGCSEENLSQVIARYKIPKSLITNYFKEILELGDTYLLEECSSVCFNNIKAWLEVLRQNNFLKSNEPLSDYIQGLINFEVMPKAKELNGVDLRAAYQFLSNGLQGLPQPPLNSETAKFLVNEMEMLIEEVNDEAGDQIAHAMYANLEKFMGPKANNKDDFGSLNPFQFG